MVENSPPSFPRKKLSSGNGCLCVRKCFSAERLSVAARLAKICRGRFSAGFPEFSTIFTAFRGVPSGCSFRSSINSRWKSSSHASENRLHPAVESCKTQEQFVSQIVTTCHGACMGLSCSAVVLLRQVRLVRPLFSRLALIPVAFTRHWACSVGSSRPFHLLCSSPSFSSLSCSAATSALASHDSVRKDDLGVQRRSAAKSR